jgi:hypothetical protein
MAGPLHQSRYQVRAAAEPAWATDDRGTFFRFDGLLFTRRRRRDGAYSVVPAWQTPCYGWLSMSECPSPAVSATAGAQPASDPRPHLAA